MIVNLEELQENGYNPNSMSDLKFNGLVDSIKAEKGNRLFPIEVTPKNEDGKYVIIDGAHRFRALKKAGLKQAVIEISDLDEGHTKLRTLSKNKLHGEHDQIKESELVSELKEMHGISEDELLSALGIDAEELIGIENLTNIDLGDFDSNGSIEDLIPKEEEEREEEKKEVTLSLTFSDFQNQIINESKKLTGTKSLEEALFIISYYFKLQKQENEVDEAFLTSAGNMFSESSF